MAGLTTLGVYDFQQFKVNRQKDVDSLVATDKIVDKKIVFLDWRRKSQRRSFFFFIFVCLFLSSLAT